MIEGYDKQINLWKSIKRQSDDVLSQISGLVFVMHNSMDMQDALLFLNKVQNNQQSSVLFFSFTMSFKYIKEIMQIHPLEKKNLHIVDFVSGFLLEEQEDIECIYRKPPGSIDDFKKQVMKNIERIKPDIIFIDSISQFINFSKLSNADLKDLYDFFSILKMSQIEYGCSVIIIFYDEKEGKLNDIQTIFTDNIIKMEVI